MSYALLKAKLAAAMGLSEREAQGKLNQNSVIKTILAPGGKRLAVFQPAYRDKPSKPHQPKQATLRQQIQAVVRQTITAQPQQEMELDRLVQMVQDKFPGRPKATIYQYLDAMPDLEKVDIAASRTKLCRLQANGSLLQSDTN